jgi:inhibitor of cysteine peptidase
MDRRRAVSPGGSRIHRRVFPVFRTRERRRPDPSRARRTRRTRLRSGSRDRLGAERLESRQVLSAPAGTVAFTRGLLVVRGDAGGGSADDSILVREAPADGTAFEVVFNGVVVKRGALSGLRRVVVDGGRGDDEIRVDIAVPSRLIGGDGDDILVGSAAADHLDGGSGHDMLAGGDGNDLLEGGTGGDLLEGGGGDDRLFGQAGSDTLVGGDGDDILVGGRGGDLLEAGAGDDILRGGDGLDTLLGGMGVDSIDSGPDPDRVFGDPLTERIRAGGRDEVVVTEADDPLMLASNESDIRRWLSDQAVRMHHESRLAESLETLQAGPLPVGDAALFMKADAPITAAAPASAADPIAGANVQVAGVDEADSVLTDGSHLYSVVQSGAFGGGELLVIDADPEHLAVVARVPLEGHSHRLYRTAGIVTVLSQVEGWSWWPMPIDPVPAEGGDDVVRILPMPMPATDPQPGSVVVAPAAGAFEGAAAAEEVVVTVLDVSHAAAPVLLETIRLDGRLVSSRGVDGSIHLVVENTPSLPAAGAGSPAGLRAAFSRADPASVLPRARTVRPGAFPSLEQSMAGPGSLYLPPRGGGTDLVSIVTLTPGDDTPGLDRAVSTLGRGGTVYATGESIVLASPDPFGWWSGGGTTLHAFALADLSYLAGGRVEGHLLDQFAIDAASDGTLRVVTQTGWGREAATNLSILDSVDGRFTTIGSLAGIAPGEETKSVRFVGDTAYVVTFEQVDPLFVIDLADPSEPAVLGELVIPGFSSHLHPVSPDHILGIGRGADPASLKLALFDVSRPSSPVESDLLEIGGQGGWTWSAAEVDHRAILWAAADALPVAAAFADLGLLAIPVTAWRPWWEVAEDPSASSPYSLEVYAVSAAGLSHVASVSHGSAVGRGLLVGPWLYSVSEEDVAVVSLDSADDPGRELARTSFLTG